MSAEESSASYRQGSDVFVLSGPARDAMAALRSNSTVAEDAVSAAIVAELEGEGVRLAHGCGRIGLAEPVTPLGK